MIQVLADCGILTNLAQYTLNVKKVKLSVCIV